MQVLNKSIVYLSGPIDHAKDHGVGWREEFKLKTEAIGLVYLDPTKKPGEKMSETTVEKNTVAEFKKNKDWDGLKKYVKNFRRIDLRFVDLSDFLVIYIDTSVHMMGSYDELFVAERQRKPIFAIVEGGIEKASSWLFGCSTEKLFNNLDECVEHLHKINNGEIKLSDKFCLIRKYINF